MVAMTVLGLVSIGVYSFTIDSTASLFVSTEKLEINRDVRNLTGELVQDARDANEFFIYRSFQVGDRDDISDQRTEGQAGDFLLLVYVDRDPVTLEEHYTGVIGYFRRPNASGDDTGPVYRFEEHLIEENWIPVDDLDGPEDLLIGYNYSDDYSQVIELAATEADESLFYNFNNDAIMVKAEILHGNDAKRVTDTYNFTISPRN